MPEADLILGNPRFVEAAHGVFGPDVVVRPTTVYVNVMVPGPVSFVPHTDVPAFRGVTRDDHPVWLLGQMMNSGLFEQWRIKLATAVSWFYEGPGGEFHYWPEGPEGDHAVIGTPYDNIAVVADNERTYHGVAPVGVDEPVITGLTHDTLLHRVDGGWEMRNGDEPVARAATTPCASPCRGRARSTPTRPTASGPRPTPTTSISTGRSTCWWPTCAPAGSRSSALLIRTTTRPGSPRSAAPTARDPRGSPSPGFFTETVRISHAGACDDAHRFGPVGARSGTSMVSSDEEAEWHGRLTAGSRSS